jgi:hypothetical protein
MGREREIDPNFQEGAPCVYDNYEGEATITRVEMTEASRAQREVVGGPGYEGFEVWFRFVPEDPIPTDHSGLLEREQLLSLRNGWYPGPRYIEKYGLEPGKKFLAVLGIIKEGVCQPAVFELDGIEDEDYFESMG